MMRGLTKALLIGLCIWAGPLRAQDSANVLTLPEFIGIVAEGHPEGMQADLQLERAIRGVQQARGAFDPVLSGEAEQKELAGTDYWLRSGASLRVPLWYGVELKAGYDLATGQYLNPERSVPDGGLAYAGLKVSLLQGLVSDARRARLQQAKVTALRGEAERNWVLNELYFQAVQAYVWWWESSAREATFREAEALSLERYRLTVQSYRGGSAAAMDTLDARSQFLLRREQRQKAGLEKQKAALLLANFLWTTEGLPFEGVESLVAPTSPALPSPPGTEGMSADAVLSRHPQLELLRREQEWLRTERRLTREYLKPKLDLSFQLLGNNFQSGDSYAFYPNNYKWGLSFSMPLFLREARSKMAQTDLKIESLQYKQDQKLWELQNKFRAVEATLDTLANRLDILEEVVGQYRELLRAEERKLQYGDSNLFMVNGRENKLIDARLKQIGIEAERLVTEAALLYALGQLIYE